MVTAPAEYSSKYPATAVADGSWADDNTGTADYWLLPSGQTGHVQLDFGTAWELQFVEIHNTDNASHTDRGTIAYHIDVSNDALFSTAQTIAAGTLLTYDQGWYCRPLESNGSWRYARFYVDDFGGSDRQNGGGLAEITFYGVPEPGTLVLLLVAIGLCGPWCRLAHRSKSPGV